MSFYYERISQLFLDLESSVGTTRLNQLVLQSLTKAIHDFKEKGEEDFFQQFYEILDLVKNTTPRIAIIIDHFFHIWNVLNEAKKKEHPHHHLYWEAKIQETLQYLRTIAKQEHSKMAQYGSANIDKNDVILIHSISGSVLDTLFEAKKRGKIFQVIVAEQEIEKTQQLIDVLTKHKIPFKVVPEYMLSHIENEVTKVFLGGVTVNSDFQVVCDAGSIAIVSEFHLGKVPIYLFISTRKFSLWKSRGGEEHTPKIKLSQTHGQRPIAFKRIKFSHDRVPLDYYDVIVTEIGRMTVQETIALFQKKFKEREEWRKVFFKE